MRKDFFRSSSANSPKWASEPENRDNISPDTAKEWLPESVLRDALIAERLPAAFGGQNLFWVNIRRYLRHDDAQLPPEEYLRHWREIYRSCLNRDTTRLRRLSYVSIEGPLEAGELN